MSNMSIKEYYNHKKELAAKRNLAWNFSLEEFEHFYKLRSTENCAYTNKKFVFNKSSNHNYYPTIERINSEMPYSLENCVWVTKVANDIKNVIIDRGESLVANTVEEENLVKSLTKLFNSPEVLSDRQKPYLDIKSNIAKENIRLANEARERKKRLEEVNVTKMFSEWGELIVDSGGRLDVRFSDYKRTLLRKKCQLTGNSLPESLSDRSVWVKDKTKPVSKDNIVCTTKIVQESLDLFEAKSKMNINEIAQVFKGVVKS